MKKVKFWEAMKARSEGKKIKRIDLQEWVQPAAPYTFNRQDEIEDWLVLEEPKIYLLCFFEDGRCECHDENQSGIYTYKGKTPIKVIKVREVIE